jgi:hypothetical protein
VPVQPTRYESTNSEQNLGNSATDNQPATCDRALFRTIAGQPGGGFCLHFHALDEYPLIAARVSQETKSGLRSRREAAIHGIRPRRKFREAATRYLIEFQDTRSIRNLLGHKAGRITTEYSVAEIRNLVAAANRIAQSRGSPALTVLRFAS